MRRLSYPLIHRQRSNWQYRFCIFLLGWPSGLGRSHRPLSTVFCAGSWVRVPPLLGPATFPTYGVSETVILYHDLRYLYGHLTTYLMLIPRLTTQSFVNVRFFYRDSEAFTLLKDFTVCDLWYSYFVNCLFYWKCVRFGAFLTPLTNPPPPHEGEDG